MATTNCGKKSHATDPGKPDGVHFMPKEQCDSIDTTDRVTQASEASFSVQTCLLKKIQ
jgi:hypothetical protein